MDDFDRDFLTCNAVNSRQQNFIVVDSTTDREFTVKISSVIPTTNENTVNVQRLERCFNEKNDKGMGNIVDTVEDKNKKPIWTASVIIITLRIELAVRSLNASSARDAASITANSKREICIGITASFENLSERNNT